MLLEIFKKRLIRAEKDYVKRDLKKLDQRKNVLLEI